MRFVYNIKTHKTNYFAHKYSNITCGVCLYGAKENMDQILKIQNTAIQLMLNLNIRESVQECLGDFNILTMYSQYIYSWVRDNQLE